MRRMGATRNVVQDEGLSRRRGVQLAKIADRVVGHARRQVVAGLVAPGENLCGIAKQERRPLVSLAAHEAVEVFKAHSGGPLIERTGNAVLVVGRVVVLPEPRGRVTVLFQDFTDGRVVDPDNGIVAGITSGLFRDNAEPDRMVIASGDDGCTGWRT